MFRFVREFLMIFLYIELVDLDFFLRFFICSYFFVFFSSGFLGIFFLRFSGGVLLFFYDFYGSFVFV